jgi:hypothetical protein
MDEALQVSGLRPAGCSAMLIGRLHAGELSVEEAAKARSHVASCPRCAATLAALERDAAELPKALPFEPFVDRTLSKTRAKRTRRAAWTGVTLALAACLAVVVVAGPLRQALFSGSRRNLHKGAGVMELYVRNNDAQVRLAGERESLARGERVRVGYEAADRSYVAVVSVDDTGLVTPLYPEKGQSLRAENSPGMHVLPDSVEFTGAGYERVITLFTDEPVPVNALVAATKKAFEKAGSVEAMGSLDLPGEQSSKLVKKQ